MERRPGERHQHRDATGVVAENIVRHAKDEIVGMGEGVGINEVRAAASAAFTGADGVREIPVYRAGVSAGGVVEERAVGKEIRAGAVEKLRDGIVRRGCAGEDHVICDPRGIERPGGENLVRLFRCEIGKHRPRVGGVDDAEGVGAGRNWVVEQFRRAAGVERLVPKCLAAGGTGEAVLSGIDVDDGGVRREVVGDDSSGEGRNREKNRSRKQRWLY